MSFLSTWPPMVIEGQPHTSPFSCKCLATNAKIASDSWLQGRGGDPPIHYRSCLVPSTLQCVSHVSSKWQG